MDQNFTQFLSSLKGKILYGEPLSKHTWLGIGGPAEVMFLPENVDDLIFFLKNKPQDIPIHILGGGSNLLVRDGGLQGVVIKLDSPYFRQIICHDEYLTCFAGVPNVTLKKYLIKNNIGGLEFLCSVPGTIGGSIKTNAGCFGQSISDILISATIVDLNGNIKEYSNSAFEFSYRQSNLSQKQIVISVNLKSKKEDSQIIRQTIEEHHAYRKAHQPYKEKTAGSTFKNPPGLSAWKLISDSDCCHLKIGGAKMSEKHCNFMINTGTATASDCEQLGETIIKKVFEKTGITLEWEVQKMGNKK